MKFWEALGRAVDGGAWIAVNRAEWAEQAVPQSRQAYHWSGRDWRVATEGPSGEWVIVRQSLALNVGQGSLSWDWEIVEVEVEVET